MEQDGQEERTNVSRKGPDPVAEARQFALTDLAGLLFEVSIDDFGDPEATQSGLKSLFGRSREDEFEQVSKSLGSSIDLQTRGENEDAAKELKKAIDLGLDMPASNFNIGLLYHTLGSVDKSFRHLQRALGDEKFSLAAHLIIAQQHRASDHMQKAAISYIEALREADALIIKDEFKNPTSSCVISYTNKKVHYYNNLVSHFINPERKMRR